MSSHVAQQTSKIHRVVDQRRKQKAETNDKLSDISRVPIRFLSCTVRSMSSHKNQATASANKRKTEYAGGMQFVHDLHVDSQQGNEEKETGLLLFSTRQKVTSRTRVNLGKTLHALPCVF